MPGGLSHRQAILCSTKLSVNVKPSQKEAINCPCSEDIFTSKGAKSSSPAKSIRHEVERWKGLPFISLTVEELQQL